MELTYGESVNARVTANNADGSSSAATGSGATIYTYSWEPQNLQEDTANSADNQVGLIWEYPAQDRGSTV